MNIFLLDTNIEECAKAHTDKHLPKMILESAQMLSTCYRSFEGNDKADKLGLYASTHLNHPCNIWVRESKSNYTWLYALLANLIVEFQWRFNKCHSTGKLLSVLLPAPEKLPGIGLTPFPLCMPGQYKTENPVISYRLYYCSEKSHLFKWTNRPTPEWIKRYCS